MADKCEICNGPVDANEQAIVVARGHTIGVLINHFCIACYLKITTFVNKVLRDKNENV